MSNQFDHQRSSTDHPFEVRHVSIIGEKVVVNLDIHYCSCLKWMLTGIPCCHALSAMKFVNVDPVNLISFWFKKATYVEVYNSIIYPVNGEPV